MKLKLSLLNLKKIEENRYFNRITYLCRKITLTVLFMNKRLALMASACCFSTYLLAQQKDTVAIAESIAKMENADFTFTESQLDEDDDNGRTVNSVLGVNNDLYLSNVGYLFSPMRFRYRAYNNQQSETYINGVQMNDAERGQFSYSSIGGLNDATRNREGSPFLNMNNFGFSALGGSTDINVRASQYSPGNKITLSGCNRNYLARGVYTYSTGLMNNGWAVTGSLAYRWANEGYIEGTFYNSLGYFLAVQKVFNDRHSLNLSTWGSPTERAQQGASTEEAYWLANSHYYNPNWGYQNGEKRNARVVNSYEPTAILTWDFNINDRTKLSTSFMGKYSMYSNTALGWSGNASDPRPDYYKKLPSGQVSVWEEANGTLTPKLEYTDEELATWNQYYNYWTSSKANRQIDWDAMYFANAQQKALGGEALYYVERRHNDQMAFNLNSTLKHTFKRHGAISAGLNIGTTKGMHYKTMSDLLGASYMTDIDKFSVRDYGYNSSMIQNDLDNPNRIIKEDDIFGYNYNIYVNRANVWSNYQITKGITTLFAAFRLGGSTIEREGLMRNGRAPKNSKGSSGVAKFLESGGKIGLTFKPSGKHTINLGLGYEENAPTAYNAFIAPRLKNDFVYNLTNEEMYTAEASYALTLPRFTMKVSGYYTRFNDLVEMDAFYNDQESRFTYLSMSGVQKEYMGVELAASVKITSNLTLNAIGTYSNAEYINNPNAILTYENESESTTDKVYAKGMKESGTPLSAYSLGLDYNVNGWFFSINGNYYHRGFIDFSTYRRLGSILNKNSGSNMEDGTVGDNGKPVTTQVPEQEEFEGGFMLDASIGKYIRMKKGRSLSLNLSVNNILNNTNMKTGGYEQNRDDKYTDTQELRTYIFSKNSKYYYAQGINAFMNIAFRF
jgi:hypothetical protein